MKLAIFAFCLFCATTALGQASGSLSAEPQITEFHSHEQQASQRDLGRAQNVMEQSSVYFGHGERPLWEVAPRHHEISLGEVARALKEEHSTAKKSKVIWTD